MRTIRVLLGAALLIGALLPASPATAAPTINILNPSGYSPTLRISTKQTSATDTTYHLVAWTGETPANPFVEFELGPTPGVVSGNDPAAIATVDGTKVGDDTFEGFLTTTTVPDGQYFLRAILYSGFVGPGTGTEVARDEVSVTVQSTEAAAANTVELAYPANAGPLGFWRTGGQKGVAVLNGFASTGTNQVRALYTLNNPGTEPTWQECGSDSVSNGTFRVRCTLETASVNPSSVKAVAVVANQTPPPGPAQAAADQTGDAHRVVPYLQNPTRITIEPGSSSTDVNKCTALVVTALDQSDVPVATLNIDVHAQGPDDQLRFATRSIDSSPQHSGFKEPDAEHSGIEATAKCEGAAPDNKQGDHNVPGGADQKHIESTAGTNNQGEFRFFLLSGQNGGTVITAWGDENDDDSVNASNEALGGAQLGWGQAPPPVSTQLTLDPSSASGAVDECVRMVASATQNGVGQSGKNIDVHITNPSGVSFCNPGDSTTSAPDGGGHAGDIDPTPENTHHAEWTSNTSGEVIFGVTSTGSGTTNVTVWLDDNNSDTQDSSETVAAGTIEWQEEGGRTISLQSSKSSARRGSKVRFFGHIDGADACSDGQEVTIRARRPSGGRWRTVGTATTDDNGDYSKRITVRRTRNYQAIAPANDPCEKAVSNKIKVRARS